MIFSSTALGFLSRSTEGVVFGRSFFAAAAMLSLVALPLIVASDPRGARTRSPATSARPPTRSARPRRRRRGGSCCRPAGPRSRPGRCSASAGSSATPRSSSSCSAPPRTSPRSKASPFPLNYLRGAGTTLTNFVYEASPTGNLNQPQKAYAAAFVLLLMVLSPERSRRRRPPPRPKGRNVEFLKSPPPPIRRLELDDPAAATQVLPPALGQRQRRTAPGGFTAARALDRRAAVLDPADGGRRGLDLLRRPKKR